MSTQASPPRAARIAWGPVFWIGCLHVGALLAFVPGYFAWAALAVCLILHWLTGSVGICLTYHRLLTHRSFALRPRWLEYPLTALGCCASEGGAIAWVADHRRHHAHADDEGDVHSPSRGFAWSHMLWWMTPDVTPGRWTEYHARWAPDLVRDPVHVWLDRWHFLFPILMGAGLYAFGGMPWLVWGGFVRSVLLLHTTWLVNSASHIWGARPHPTRDSSTNLWWVALLAYGEGWHNNHHAFPTSARHGLRWWEVDMTYGLIRLLAWVKLAATVKVHRETPTSSSPAATAWPRNGAGPESKHASGFPSEQRRGPAAVAFASARQPRSPLLS